MESDRIGKSQNAIFSPNWKVSESVSDRIGKCQTLKVPELEGVRISKCQNWKVSELLEIRKCQNCSELESVRIQGWHDKKVIYF